MLSKDSIAIYITVFNGGRFLEKDLKPYKDGSGRPVKILFLHELLLPERGPPC